MHCTVRSIPAMLIAVLRRGAWAACLVAVLALGLDAHPHGAGAMPDHPHACSAVADDLEPAGADDGAGADGDAHTCCPGQLLATPVSSDLPATLPTLGSLRVAEPLVTPDGPAYPPDLPPARAT